MRRVPQHENAARGELTENAYELDDVPQPESIESHQ